MQVTATVCAKLRQVSLLFHVGRPARRADARGVKSILQHARLEFLDGSLTGGSLKATMFCPERRRFCAKRRGSTSAAGFAGGTPVATEVEGLKGRRGFI